MLKIKQQTCEKYTVGNHLPIYLFNICRCLCRGFHEDEAVLTREGLSLFFLNIATSFEVTANNRLLWYENCLIHKIITTFSQYYLVTSKKSVLIITSQQVFTESPMKTHNSESSATKCSLVIKWVSERVEWLTFTSCSAQNRLFWRQVISGNHLHWYG